MNENPLEPILGRRGRDPGCEAAFGQLDRYCEAVHRGEDVSRRYVGFIAHIRNCVACREDAEGLLAALEDMERPEPER